jgi:hypothetical protein
LKTTPTGENTLRNVPPQAGHSVSGGSEKLWTASSRSAQEVQAYSYVGTGGLLGALALSYGDC